jgi:hypothetical protein
VAGGPFETLTVPREIEGVACPTINDSLITDNFSFDSPFDFPQGLRLFTDLLITDFGNTGFPPLSRKRYRFIKITGEKFGKP